MKHLIKKTKFRDAETLDPVSMTVQGAALSVEELYKKMIVGSIDAAGYVHPVEYDENPDIDNPDPLNTFGLDVGEVEEIRDAQLQLAKEELARAKKKKEGSEKEPDKEPLTPEPGQSAAQA